MHRFRRSSFAVAVTIVMSLTTSTAIAVPAQRTVAASVGPWTATNAVVVDPSGNTFSGVSCVTASWCVAVGRSGALADAANIQLWDGNAWSAMTAAHPGNNGELLTSVSCLSATFCMAVGRKTVNGITTTLVERYDGASWSVVPSSSTGPVPQLDAISCASSTMCMAVGSPDVTVRFNTLPLVLLWDGNSFNPVSHPAFSMGGGLAGVTCTTNSSCIVVGAAKISNVLDLPVVERYANSTWSTIAGINLGGNSGRLKSVSCTAPTSCVVAGFRYNGSGDPNALIAMLNGTTWTTPTLSGDVYRRSFDAVTCGSPTSCVAVGLDALTPGSLVMTWDGSTWTLAASASPSQLPNLLSVACPSSCVAVGRGITPFSIPGEEVALVGPQPSTTRSVTTSWSTVEATRLQQMATYLGQTPDQVQQTAVYLTSFLLGFSSSGLAPQTLPPAGSSTSYATNWTSPELSVLGTTSSFVVLNDAEATRWSVYILDFLLGLGGH